MVTLSKRPAKDLGKGRLVDPASCRGFSLGDFAPLDGLADSGDQHALRRQFRSLGGTKADVSKDVARAFVDGDLRHDSVLCI